MKFSNKLVVMLGVVLAIVLAGSATWAMAQEGDQGEQGETVKSDPPCFDNANRYVDCGNGTVMDTVTGLIWLKNANCFGPTSYADASNAAVGLQDGDCDLTDNSSPGDWRLPTKAEWEATIAQAQELGCSAPILTNTAGIECGSGPFTDVQPIVYWSSNAFETFPSYAWGMHLHKGWSYTVPKIVPNLFVWPVRGGQ